MRQINLRRGLTFVVALVCVCSVGYAQSGLLNVTGAWETNWGTMCLIQAGGHVTGYYTHDTGRIDGALQGLTLTGGWAEAPSYTGDGDSGGIAFQFSDDGNTFTGTWGYGANAAGSAWNGHRTATEVSIPGGFEAVFGPLVGVSEVAYDELQQILSDPDAAGDIDKLARAWALVSQINGIKCTAIKLMESEQFADDMRLLEFRMQERQRMLQALTSLNNTLHSESMRAIRNLRN